MPTTPYATQQIVESVIGTLPAADSAAINLFLGAASQAIDRETGRRFDTVTEARTFDTAYTSRLLVGDVVSVSGITFAYVTGDTPVALTSTDYYLGPHPKPSGVPYQWIDLSDAGDYRGYGYGYRLVTVTGVWGWPSVPADIQMLTVSLAIRLWRRAAAGAAQIADVPGLGTLQFDSDFTQDEKRTLARYRRVVFA